METIAPTTTETVARGARRSDPRTVLAACAVALPLVAVALGQLRFLHDNAVPEGDEATLELSIRSALAGRQLLGPWSRYGENSGWFHPGPIMYYLLAPFYSLGGRRHAALAIGALAIVAVSLVAVVVVASKRYGATYGVAAAAALVVYEWRFGLDQLRSAWNPLLVIAPLIVVIVAAQAITPTSRRWLPIAIVAFGTVAVQSHVGTLPVVAVMIAVAVVSSVRSRSQFVAQWSVAIGVGVALWLLPLIEQLPKGRRGNIALIVRHFVTVGRRGNRSTTPTLLARAITLQPSHLGRWYGPEGSWNPLPHPRGVMWLTLVACPFVVVALIAWGRRRGIATGRRLVAPLLAVGIGALGLYLATDPPPPYLATPLLAGAVALWVTIAASGVELLSAGWQRRPPSMRRAAARATAIGLAPFVALAFAGSPSITADAFRSYASSDRVTTAYMSTIAASLAPVCAARSTSVQVVVDGQAWSAALGAGVALQRCGKHVTFSSNVHHLVGDRYTTRDAAFGSMVLFQCAGAPVPSGGRTLYNAPPDAPVDDSGSVVYVSPPVALPTTPALHACTST